MLRFLVVFTLCCAVFLPSINDLSFVFGLIGGWMICPHNRRTGNPSPVVATAARAET